MRPRTSATASCTVGGAGGGGAPGGAFCGEAKRRWSSWLRSAEKVAPTKAIDLASTAPEAAVAERHAMHSSSAPSACRSSA